MKKVFYVLFENHESGLTLHRLLKENKLSSTISPAPRNLIKCCGISLIVKEEEIQDVWKVVEENDVSIIDIKFIERDINPNRDRYC